MRGIGAMPKTCKRKWSRLGVSAVASSIAAGVAGLTYGLYFDAVIHVVLGAFWLLASIISYRIYSSLPCADE